MSKRVLATFIGFAIVSASAAFGASVFFDFGDGAQTTPGYNNIVHYSGYPTPPVGVPNAVDSDGNATGISVAVTDIFWPGSNYNGTQAPTGAAAQFDMAATRDSFFGSTVAFGGYTEPTGGFTLSGLNPAYTYQFTFFASRTGVSDNREAAYAVAGATNQTVYLDAANNISNVAMTGQLVPTANGQMMIGVGPGPNNTNGSKFYYIGAMRIDIVPEPSTAVTLALGALLLSLRSRRA